jgi:DNA-binding protein YbaB
MFDNIDMKEILAKAQEMQEQFQKMQTNFAGKEIHGMAGVDDVDEVVVKVVLDGTRMVKKLFIGKGAKEQKTEVLIDLIVAAINSATEKLNGEMQNQVQSIYQSSGLPTDKPKSNE